MRLEPPVPPAALAAIRAPFALLGAPFVDAPVMLPLGLMLDLAGETMRGRLFLVQGDGENGPEADAEVAGLAWRAAAAGGRTDLVMILGDVALFAAFIDAIGLAPALAARLKRAFARPGALADELTRAQAAEPAARQGDRIAELLAGLPEAEATAVLQDLWSIAGIQPVGGRSAGEIAHRLVQRGEAARAPRLAPAEARLIRDLVDLSGPARATLDRVAELARGGGLNLDAELDAWAQRLGAMIAHGARE